MAKMELAFVPLAFVELVFAPAFAVDAAQPARPVDVSDHLFGIDLPAPYRWTENAHNEEFNAWQSAQGSCMRVRPDASPQQVQ
ncbi:MAG TPA: hypothetical protein VF472_24835 [Burkholderiaceae bacterium]